MNYDNEQIKELEFDKKKLAAEGMALKEDVLFLTRLARQKSQAYDATEEEIDRLYQSRQKLREELWEMTQARDRAINTLDREREQKQAESSYNNYADTQTVRWELLNKLPRRDGTIAQPAGIVDLEDIRPFFIDSPITTIKMIRCLSGGGLKESKDLFDGWKAQGLI